MLARKKVADSQPAEPNTPAAAAPAAPADPYDIVIHSSPRPKLMLGARISKKLAPTYQAAATLKPGQWFEVPQTRGLALKTLLNRRCYLRAGFRRRGLKFVSVSISANPAALIVSCAGEWTGN